MRIGVVSDGRRGIENQALGLAEAVAAQYGTPCEIATHRLSHGAAFAALPPSLQLLGRRSFALPDAELLIGCGRQAVAPLLSARRAGASAFTVFVQDPRVEPSRFDLVVAPEHDGLSGPFVETMIGSPNRVTRDRLIGETLAHADRLAPLPMPRAMIAVGGDSRTHRMDGASVQAHLDAVATLSDRGYSLLVTTSRRTPDAVVGQWKALAEATPHVWLDTPERSGANPYFAFLGGADLILVTEDSTNMLTEACATGKPTSRLPMGGNPGKFVKLYTALEARCGVRRWSPDAAPQKYQTLRETDRVARAVLDRMAR
ncbi:MAG: mitochondrial fission ELM1 family protein [Pseudomonadota bacterium]